VKLEVKPVTGIKDTDQRKRWQADPRISRYFQSGTSPVTEDSREQNTEYYEIYLDDALVGDIKLFMEEEDIAHNRIQLMILIGEPKIRGIGTEAIKKVLLFLQGRYASVYCVVNRYNIASIKMLQKNNFRIEDFRGSDVVLLHTLAAR
jgi:RimJ/RimL family protein N-acetyltransferase